MKLAIDARWIFPRLSGVGVYTRELIRALVALEGERPETLLIFSDPDVMRRIREETGFDRAAGITAERYPHGVFSLRSQLGLGPWLRKRGVQAYLSPNWMIPVLPGALRGLRVGVTLHDLIPLVLPGHAPNSLKSRLHVLYRALMRRVAQRADVLFTVSEASRRDIEALLIPPGAPSKVVVAPNGVSPRFQPGDAPRGNTVLYVGRLDPYKNVPALIEAFALALPRLPPDTRLRIVGAPDPRYPEAGQTAERLGVTGRVDWDGNLDGDGLLRAYQTAAVLVLASRYEGFGLPVVEAMACGTPVICSNVSSLPEVAGDAALLVPPGDPVALAAALVSMLQEPLRRADLSAKGLERARAFTWERSARLHLRALRA